jgi:uncharacterized protein YndB with AHSA1/START domain
MTQSARDLETRSIVVEFDYPYPPEKVWRALTEPDLIAKWLMPNDFAPVPGHTFTMRTRPMGKFDGIAHCEVLEAVPNERLRYTWRGGSPEQTGYGAYLDTTVTFDLTPTDGGTHLRLEHAGFTPSASGAYEIMTQGWQAIPARILAIVEAVPER